MKRVTVTLTVKPWELEGLWRSPAAYQEIFEPALERGYFFFIRKQLGHVLTIEFGNIFNPIMH